MGQESELGLCGVEKGQHVPRCAGGGLVHAGWVKAALESQWLLETTLIPLHSVVENTWPCAV